MDKLNELTQRFTDAVNAIKNTVPVIGIQLSCAENAEFLMSQRDFEEHFSTYFMVPWESGDYHSELYTMVNGVKFHAISKQSLPAGTDKIVVTKPADQEAV